MQRALVLAAQGRGRVEPNPMVGCVITQGGRIIGEGYHRAFGLPHAEREALAACTESPAGATAYVTLEPCCHTNKKTPPASPPSSMANIARVVVACLDPNPSVAGQGIAQLRAANIHVELGLLQSEAQQLNAPFFASVLHARPYVTLKWAQSADLKVAGHNGAPLPISNALSRRHTHQLRARCDAILVGINTILIDDPLLTARDVEQLRPLRRIILDSDLRLPSTSKICHTARESPVIVYCSDDAMRDQRPAARTTRLAWRQRRPAPHLVPRPTLTPPPPPPPPRAGRHPPPRRRRPNRYPLLHRRKSRRPRLDLPKPQGNQRPHRPVRPDPDLASHRPGKFGRRSRIRTSKPHQRNLLRPHPLARFPFQIDA